jgi:thiol-disulfide isomerase/thioredoxin
MKFLTTFAFVFFMQTMNAQTPYTIVKDEKNPGGLIYTGLINKYTLINEASFKWYNENQKNYKPSTELLNGFEAAKSKVHFVVFGGTWCDDTQFILPKFFKLQQLSGISDSCISFFGVNRDKKTIENVAAAFNITNVPTIIVMKSGKEIGRVVEYGKSGEWDKEILELIK